MFGIRCLVCATIIVNTAASLQTMPAKRKRPAASGAEPSADTALHQKLAQCGTRTGLIAAIGHLSDAGWFKPRVLQNCTSGTRQRLGSALREHAGVETPYGTVIQKMKMPLKDLPRWSYVHPMALLYHLSSMIPELDFVGI